MRIGQFNSMFLFLQHLLYFCKSLIVNLLLFYMSLKNWSLFSKKIRSLRFSYYLTSDWCYSLWQLYLPRCVCLLGQTTCLRLTRLHAADGSVTAVSADSGKHSMSKRKTWTFIQGRPFLMIKCLIGIWYVFQDSALKNISDGVVCLICRLEDLTSQNSVVQALQEYLYCHFWTCQNHTPQF